jgi:hypothetical protein
MGLLRDLRGFVTFVRPPSARLSRFYEAASPRQDLIDDACGNVGIRSVDFHISTRRLSFPAIDALTWAVANAGRPSIRVDERSTRIAPQHVMRVGAGALSH